MACCKAEEYGGWCSRDKVRTVMAKDGKDYCIFHAPEKGNLKEFENEVFSRIKATAKGESCDFSGTVFEGDISFGEFDENNPLPAINFLRATFSKGADFCGATFSGEAYFPGATFSGGADFRGATFSGGAYFLGTTFSGEVDFRVATFSRGAHFLDATFSKGADFRGATFSRRAYFFDAKFSGEADFFDAKFSKEANFFRATFSGKASFYSATFSGEADFSSATFSKGADFFRATFGGGVRFSDAKFHGEAKFEKTSFKDADFLRTVFYERAHFNMAEFGEGAYFKGEIFLGQDGAEFTSVAIKDRVRFEGVNLKRVSFGDTDLRRVELVNPAFIGKKRIPTYILNRVSGYFAKKIEDIFPPEHILYDEFSFFGKRRGDSFLRRCCSGDDFNYFREKFEKERFGIERSESGREELKKVERLYRRLKQRCIEDHAERSVSHWHFREKEMFRIGIPRWRRYVGLTSIYCLSSGYGERPFRAGIFLGFLIVATSIALGIFGLIPFVGEDVYGIERINGFVDIFNPHKLWALFLNTLQYVTFQKDPYFKPDSLVGASIKLFAQIFIPLQTALFALALRNRYRR